MKKALLFLLAAVMVFSFVACEKQTEKKAEPSAASEVPAETAKSEKGNEEEVVYAGTYNEPLKMGTNAAFPPYEYKEGEAFKGIDVEIAEALATELGTTLEIVDMEFDSIIAAVQQGEVHVGIAGMTVTDERKEEVDFTYSYATGVQVVIVPEDSSIASLDDLEGKKIGTQLGTTGDMYSKDDYGEENVISYGKGADAIIALKGGDVDAVIIDNEPAKAFVAENEGLKILDTEYAVEDYAIAVSKDNKVLLDDLNKALEKLTASGAIDTIIAKYIKAE